MSRSVFILVSCISLMIALALGAIFYVRNGNIFNANIPYTLDLVSLNSCLEGSSQTINKIEYLNDLEEGDQGTKIKAGEDLWGQVLYDEQGERQGTLRIYLVEERLKYFRALNALDLENGYLDQVERSVILTFLRKQNSNITLEEIMSKAKSLNCRRFIRIK